MLPLRARMDFLRDVTEGAFCIPQSSSITGVSLSDCLMSYPGNFLAGSYTFAEMQSVYSTAPADGADYSSKSVESF